MRFKNSAMAIICVAAATVPVSSHAAQIGGKGVGSLNALIQNGALTPVLGALTKLEDPLSPVLGPLVNAPSKVLQALLPGAKPLFGFITKVAPLTSDLIGAVTAGKPLLPGLKKLER